MQPLYDNLLNTCLISLWHVPMAFSLYNPTSLTHKKITMCISIYIYLPSDFHLLRADTVWTSIDGWSSKIKAPTATTKVPPSSQGNYCCHYRWVSFSCLQFDLYCHRHSVDRSHSIADHIQSSYRSCCDNNLSLAYGVLSLWWLRRNRNYCHVMDVQVRTLVFFSIFGLVSVIFWNGPLEGMLLGGILQGQNSWTRQAWSWLVRQGKWKNGVSSLGYKLPNRHLERLARHDLPCTLFRWKEQNWCLKKYWVEIKEIAARDMCFCWRS